MLVRVAILTVAGMLAIQPSVRAQAQRRYIEAAIWAQAGGIGGCRSIQSERQMKMESFHDVQFLEAQCVLEHGDTARVVVGYDSTGQVFLTTGASDFEFLRLLHPPEPITDSLLISYAWEALVLMGEISSTDTLVRETRQLSRATLRVYGTPRSRLMATKVEPVGRSNYRLYLTFLGSSHLTSVDLVIDANNGSTTVIKKDAWHREPYPHP
jgi:hypothetical protein